MGLHVRVYAGESQALYGQNTSFSSGASRGSVSHLGLVRRHQMFGSCEEASDVWVL